MDSQCPETVELGKADETQNARIRESVLKKIGAAESGAENKKPRRVLRKSLRTVLLAAVIAAMMGTAAFAGSRYFLNLRQTETPVSGYWREVDDEGRILNEQKLVYPDAGMVLSFEGPLETRNLPEFRCWYLPSESTFGFTDAEGWSKYLSDNGSGPSIPYVVGAGIVRPGNHRLVINGKVSVVCEEDWGDWHVIELTSDYTACKQHWAYERANYVLLFRPETGWLIQVSGTAELETLVHIARELEIRESGQAPYPGSYDETIGMIDPGRG